MYHPYRKNSSYLRIALCRAHKNICVYCGDRLQYRHMHVDHILPTNLPAVLDPELVEYLDELRSSGFIVDSIENYLPSCAACNIQKSNRPFLVSSLRFYHDKARNCCEAILSEIEKLQRSESESFFEPVDQSQWEELDFAYQRDISNAIMGYRLTPADVLACPRFPQVDILKNRLEIVDYAILQGQPGCGKSISLYQAAFDYYKNGWHVYRYRGDNNATAPVLPQNSEPSLLLFDDAQNLSDEMLKRIQEQARPNRKIMLAKTISSAINFDSIQLTNQEAVSILEEYCLKNIGSITPIIHKCDRDVGVGYFDLPVERRIRDAGTSVSPWVFCYTLRGGWKAMRAQYSNIREHRQCGLLAALIAIFQVSQKDRNVDFDWLCQWIMQFDSSLVWTQDDLKYLIDRKIVLSIDDVRIIHIQSANIIIAQYLNESTKDDLLRLQQIVETAYCENRISPLGIVWLCNGPCSYTRIRNHEQYFITEKIIAHTLDNLAVVQVSSERMGIAFFLEKVLNKRDQPHGVQYFQQIQDFLRDWISHADSDTAYSYGNMLNALYNADKEAHLAFVTNIDWTSIITAMENDPTPFFYGWGYMINRLAMFQSEDSHSQLTQVLRPYIEKTVPIVTTANILDFSECLCYLAYYLPDASDFVCEMLPTYHKLFVDDMAHAFSLFDYRFLSCFCGIPLFGNAKVSDKAKNTTTALIKVIPEREFAVAVSNSYPRDWQQIYRIMHLISRYDKHKVQTIIQQIDLNALSRWENVWSSSHDVIYICCTLGLGGQTIAKRYIELCLKYITKIYSPVALCAPRYALQLFDKGIPIEMMTDHHWDISYSLLKQLIRLDIEKTASVLSCDITNIAASIAATSALDFTEGYYLNFLKCISNHFPAVFREIVHKVDITKIEEKWENACYDPKKKKIVYKRYAEFHQLLISTKEKLQ